MPEQPDRKNIIIALRDIRKSFDTKGQQTVVLRGVDLDIHKGELLMIFGPSGCGKSTLLNVILGLEQPDTGTVDFLGINLWTLNEDDRASIRKRTIGTMNQQQFWINSLTVKENVAFPRQLLGSSFDEALPHAEEKLTLVGMSHRIDYIPRELSSGEQQKISLARALISNPTVIISDEPTGNLDVKSGFELMDLLASLRDNGATIVMVTHNPEYLSYADRVIFMIDGKIHKDVRPQKKDVSKIRKELTETLKQYLRSDSTGDASDEENSAKSTRTSKTSRSIIRTIQSFATEFRSDITDFFTYFISISAYLLTTTVTHLSHKILRKKPSEKILKHVKRDRASATISPGINSFDVVDLSYKNLMNKRVRTFITIGAMGIGIGFVMFLISIGYGLRDLIVSRIATVEDTRQIEIAAPASSNIFLDDSTIAKVNNINGIETTQPLISIAGQITYNDSLSDVVAHGVRYDYLEHTSIRLSGGEFFDPPQEPEDQPDSDDQTASPETSPETGASEPEAEPEPTPDDTPIQLDYQDQVVINEQLLQTLGIEAEAAIGATVQIAYIPVGSGIENEGTSAQETGTDDTPNGLNDTEDPDENTSDMTRPLPHTIVGVVADDNPPVAYVPISNIKMLGLSTYTQLTAILETNDQDLSTTTRKTIEAMGYETHSTFDTISQVDRIFRYINIALLTIGLVALSVAVLGMVNTLTVSLLERTHEVGLMKALGMMSKEIRFLFISESMLISIFGGILGIAIGVLEGKTLSLVLSAISISRGEEAIDVTSIPWYLIIVVVVAAGIVGFLTGLYPSRRAVRMSALDALRYE